MQLLVLQCSIHSIYTYVYILTSCAQALKRVLDKFRHSPVHATDVSFVLHWGADATANIAARQSSDISSQS